MTKRTVAVTGIGINSALGTGLDANSQALQAGKSGIVSIRDQWEKFAFKSLVAGDIRVDGLKERFDRKQLRFMCEAALLAAASTSDAIEDAGLTEAEVQSPDTGIIMGTGAGASSPDVVFMCDRLRNRGARKLGAYHTPIIMGSSLTANIGSIFQIHGHSYSITSACATSGHAIMLGMDTIRSGRQKRMIVGGAEDINQYNASSFDGMLAMSSAFNDEPEKSSRPLDRDRDGFVFSGGSGIVVLEELETAKARNARIYGLVVGAGATCDGQDMVAPNGMGAERAMRTALDDAELNSEQIDYLNLHGTSTPLGDPVEIRAVQSVFGAKVPAFSSTKSMTGHALGAAGSQEAIFCLLMMRDRFLAPNINLDNPDPCIAGLPIVSQTREATPRIAMSNSFGFGGTNCTLILRSYDGSAQPVPDDGFDGVTFHGFVGEQLIGNLGNGSPLVREIHGSMELKCCLFKQPQPGLFLAEQCFRCFPGNLPVGRPFCDQSRVVPLASIDHFSHGAGQRNQNETGLQFLFGKFIQRPMHFDIRESGWAVVPIRFDRYKANPGTDINRHKRMARFMVSVNFRGFVCFVRFVFQYSSK